MIFLYIVNINKNLKKIDEKLNTVLSMYNRATYCDQTQAIM